MSSKVFFPNSFTKKANKIARKYPSLKVELRKLHEQLALGKHPGDRLKYVGAEVRKVRLGNIMPAKVGKAEAFVSPTTSAVKTSPCSLSVENQAAMKLSRLRSVEYSNNLN